MSPIGSDLKSMAEKRDHPVVVAAPNEDQSSGGVDSEIGREERRERAASGGPFRTRGMTNRGGGTPTVRALDQVLKGSMLEAPPDLGLPSAIEVFDGILKARFSWRSKHRSDAEQQAGAHDLANDIAMLMRALKDCGV